MKNHKNYLSQTSYSMLEGKRVLLRLDLNVPIKDGIILDTTRIERSVSTINYILSYKDTKLIIISHLGRPNRYDQSFSLKPVCKALKEYGLDIAFDTSNFMQNENSIYTNVNTHRAIMLENLRFYDSEALNDKSFAKALANLADVYVNDAFSASHRKHASIDAITQFFDKPYFGINFQREVEALDNILSASSSEDIKTVIIAGKKVSTKFQALKVLSQRVDYLIIAGAMANTFLAAEQKNNLGASYIENEMIPEIKSFIKQPHEAKLILPNDFITVKNIHDKETSIKKLEDMQDDDIALDLGPSSINHIKEILSQSNLLLWNGPLGYYEDSRFLKSTHEVAKHVTQLTKRGSLESIAGGGDIVAALAKLQMLEEFSYISTAGGALLDYISCQ